MDFMDRKKIRHLFFVGTLRGGGAERVISTLTQKMAERGMDVKILLYYEDPPFYKVDPRVEVIHVRKETKSGNVLKNALWIRKFFKEQADVVLSFLAPFNILALVANMGTRVPLIVADRNDPRYVPGNRLIRMARDFLYRFADGVVLQTENNRAYFSKAVQRKSVVIYNPVDLGDKAALALRTPKEKKIVSMGRLRPQKNQVMLLNAFSRIRQQFPEHKLVIYGEGESRKVLEDHINALGLGDCVQLPGSAKDVHERILDAECFVLCSNYEGMPNALIEAMCLGLPVISTKVSGTTELVEEEKSGLLINCGDEDALVAAMTKMLQDDALKETCAGNAIKLNEALTVDRICDQWDSYIQAVLHNK